MEQWVHVSPCAEIPEHELPSPRAIELVRRHDNRTYCWSSAEQTPRSQSVNFYRAKRTDNGMAAHPVQALHVALKAVADKDAVYRYIAENIAGHVPEGVFAPITWILRDGLQRIYQRMPRAGYFYNLVPNIKVPRNELTPRARKDIFASPFGAILFLFKRSLVTKGDLAAFEEVSPELREAVLSFLNFELKYSEAVNHE